MQVAAYEFTTLTCIPGVVHYRGAKIQMLDLPGIIEGAKDGKGRGRQVCIDCHLCYAFASWADRQSSGGDKGAGDWRPVVDEGQSKVYSEGKVQEVLQIIFCCD